MVETRRMENGNGRYGWPVGDHRRMVDNGWDENRRRPLEGVRDPPKTVERALNEDCHIEVKEYFLATVLRDGGVEYFSSAPDRLSPSLVPHVFNMEQFLRAVDSPEAPASHNSSPSPVTSRRVRAGYGNGPQRTTASRKGPREQTIPAPVRKIALRIGNSEGVWEFYLQRFRSVQQNACKLIAKAWIKAVAPKKQSTYPYTGSQIPDWWPKPWGSTEFERVRHREPDHLKRHERIPLCAHILRLVVEPNENQHKDIRQHNLTVAKLEKVARDALKPFLDESSTNEAKLLFLKEALKVAKMEEQYKRGEIGGSTDAYIMPADRIPVEEDEADPPDDGSASPQSISVESNLNIMLGGQSPTTTIPGPAAMMTLPSPSPHYGPGQLTTAMGSDQSPYAESMDIDDRLHSQHGSSRRTSTYTSSPSEYASSLGPQVTLYPPSAGGPPWQQTTSAPPNGAMFAFSHSQGAIALPAPHPQAHHAQAHAAGYGTHLDHQLGQPQYLGSPFDGLPNANAVFRNAGASPGHGAAPGYGQREYGH
ncbi:hypothetical protein QBC37DRAFT_26932 [Rhypophila decipiens]|uniref:Subtelomeric hrmA-associated cluster protein AFUB-079030/YDR124W-like helical bundle domain-containing protein n=1 Tax=Rhypophila decipiens TaxID=261697 RepID=A0AAN7BBN8_9PEZI|nr:hypothetical protein QBC37DRAFT_26932 [Rhypophila decipiens]